MAIFIVRHGESVGNVDIKNYQKIADHSFSLTETGVGQAREAAKLISCSTETLWHSGRSITVWNSPFERARHTSDVIFDVLKEREHVLTKRIESPLIIEKQYGLYNSIAGEGEYFGESFEEHFPKYTEEYRRCDEYNGRFFARPPGGESDFDVFQRCEIFWEKLHRFDSVRKNHHVIVCHGTTMRLLAMAYLDKPYEWFQKSKLPKNGSVIVPRLGILREDLGFDPIVEEE